MVYCPNWHHYFQRAGGELIYNTVGINKHIGFFSSWLIMAAWIAVPPSAVMAIVQWMFHVLHIKTVSFLSKELLLVALIGYCALSLQEMWRLLADPVIHAHVYNWRLYCGNHRIPVLRVMEF